jgi:hypothetical protein
MELVVEADTFISFFLIKYDVGIRFYLMVIYEMMKDGRTNENARKFLNTHVCVVAVARGLFLENS